MITTSHQMFLVDIMLHYNFYLPSHYATEHMINARHDQDECGPVLMLRERS